MHEVDGELVDTELAEFLQTGNVGCLVAKDAEPVDDLVGHEIGVNVASPTVLRIVVASAGFDVVGKRLRYRAPVGPVSAD